MGEKKTDETEVFEIKKYEKNREKTKKKNGGREEKGELFFFILEFALKDRTKIEWEETGSKPKR